MRFSASCACQTVGYTIWEQWLWRRIQYSPPLSMTRLGQRKYRRFCPMTLARRPRGGIRRGSHSPY